MAKGINLVMRIVALSALGILIIVLGNIMNPDVFDFWVVLELLGLIRDLISYLGYLMLMGVMSGLILLISSLLSIMVNASLFYNVAMVFAYQIVGRWFLLPTFSDVNVIPTLDEALQEFLRILFSFKDMWYELVLNGVLIVLILYVIRWIISADTQYGINIIVTINIILFVPMFVYGLRDFIDYLTVTVGSNFGVGSGQQNVVTQYLNSLLSIEILTDNFFLTYTDNADQGFIEFITSPIFFVAAMSFVFLEFIFQLSYVDQVTRPSIEREERLTSQIKILRIEAERAVGNIKLIEEARQKEEQLKLQTATKEREKQKDQEKKGNELKDYMAESGKVQFSYISELIERKKLEREQKAIMDAMKDTRRLSYYLDKLFKQDPQAFGNLTAKTSSPSAKGLIRSTIFNLLFRITVITILTWCCMHPKYVFIELFRAPDSISKSVELLTPEAVLSIFLPFVMIIPLASLIIRVTKHNKLKELLRMEEIQRSGLSEEEFEELQRKRASVAGEEESVGMAEDADAAANAKPASAPTQQTPP